jgi:hypothetical protein
MSYRVGEYCEKSTKAVAENQNQKILIESFACCARLFLGMLISIIQSCEILIFLSQFSSWIFSDGHGENGTLFRKGPQNKSHKM